MISFIFWIIVFYILFKAARIFLSFMLKGYNSGTTQKPQKKSPSNNYNNIEEADYKDIDDGDK